jgi:excisionase family DNA binding protein
MSKMSSSDTQNCWCNIKTAAAHLGMSISFVRKAVRQQAIPYVRVGNKALRFRKNDLDRWLELECESGKDIGQEPASRDSQKRDRN